MEFIENITNPQVLEVFKHIFGLLLVFFGLGMLAVFWQAKKFADENWRFIEPPKGLYINEKNEWATPFDLNDHEKWWWTFWLYIRMEERR